MAKKLAAAILTCTMTIALLPATAFASVYTPGVGATYVVANPICGIETCLETVDHYHDGVCYAGHSVGDGHTYHAVCGTYGCANINAHSHYVGRGYGCGGGGHHGGGRHHR